MIKRSLSQADGSEEKISQKVTVVNLPIYHEPISPAVGAVGIIQREKRVSSNVVQDHIEQPQCFFVCGNEKLDLSRPRFCKSFC